ncbi:MAG: DUF2065 domain-containing protein [Sphingomonadales bacterium]
MRDLGIVLGAILVIEGALYALFPGAMKSMMALMLTKPDRSLSVMGLGCAVLGFLMVWLLQG